ncbi:hypothetical protein [Streptococcus anginosus]|uniref:hypothetical protein n=1 Tax=Streptococcus anginosus TaxID=1328 RepID=UPI003F774CE3
MTVFPKTKEAIDMLDKLNDMPIKEEQYDKILNELPKEVEKNYQDYKNSLQSPQPFYIDQPKVENGELVLKWMSS